MFALVSDFDNPAEQYDNLLQELGIDDYFKPFKQMVTLSIEVGVTKPHEKIFRMAIDKIHKNLPYSNVIFITEDGRHIARAQDYGMATIHFRPSGQTNGDIGKLTSMIPLITRFLST